MPDDYDQTIYLKDYAPAPYRIDRIVSVRDLIQELVADCRAHLDQPAA